MMSTLIEARRLLREGRVAEAGHVCETVLERLPDDVDALNIAALDALRVGKPVKAVATLERAILLNPADAFSFHRLGLAQESVGDLPAAIRAVAEAVRLRADFCVSRLHYAKLLERGETEVSVMQFARALHDAQSRGKWINSATTPVGLQNLVEHAVEIVRTKRRKLLFAIAAILGGRHGKASMARVEKCLRIYLREEPAALPDPCQQPSFLYFPDLPTSAYLDRALFRGLRHSRHKPRRSVRSACDSRCRRRDGSAYLHRRTSSGNTCAGRMRLRVGMETTSIATACVATTTAAVVQRWSSTIHTNTRHRIAAMSRAWI